MIDRLPKTRAAMVVYNQHINSLIDWGMISRDGREFEEELVKVRQIFYKETKDVNGWEVCKGLSLITLKHFLEN